MGVTERSESSHVLLDAGYPYYSEDDMKKPLQQLFDPLTASDSPLHHGNQLIVMTHVGPESCEYSTDKL